jgi:hypothetical protein
VTDDEYSVLGPCTCPSNCEIHGKARANYASSVRPMPSPYREPLVDANRPVFIASEEASPEECRRMTLAEIAKAGKADSIEHCVMHLETALIWARGADWPKKAPAIPACEACGLDLKADGSCPWCG